jgi:hypothetical protein
MQIADCVNEPTQRAAEGGVFPTLRILRPHLRINRDGVRYKLAFCRPTAADPAASRHRARGRPLTGFLGALVKIA